jgi:hypothetical protein
MAKQKASKRKRSKALLASTAAVKRTPSKRPDLCTEIRRLMREIPRLWDNAAEPGTDGATREAQRNWRQATSEGERLTRLVGKLGRKRAHTKKELATLTLATAYWYDTCFNGRLTSMGDCEKRGAPAMLLLAMLRHFCGIKVRHYTDGWEFTLPWENRTLAA